MKLNLTFTDKEIKLLLAVLNKTSDWPGPLRETLINSKDIDEYGVVENRLRKAIRREQIKDFKI